MGLESEGQATWPAARPSQRPDWRPRYQRSRLEGAALEVAIEDFIVEVRRAEAVFRRFLLANGMGADCPSLAYADKGLIPERGPLPDGGGYWCHGIGAVIKIPRQPAVDVDWTGDGKTIIDPHRMQAWLQAMGP